MSIQTVPSASPKGEVADVGGLSPLDRFLPVWIIAAMAFGLLLGSLIPALWGRKRFFHPVSLSV